MGDYIISIEGPSPTTSETTSMVPEFDFSNIILFEFLLIAAILVAILRLTGKFTKRKKNMDY